MDQPSGRSFMQVLCEKYSPENFPYRRGPGMGVHVPATPHHWQFWKSPKFPPALASLSQSHPRLFFLRFSQPLLTASNPLTFPSNFFFFLSF